MKKILKSKLFHTILGLSVSAGLLIWLSLILNWGEVWAALREAQYWAIAPVILSLVVHYVIRARRWRYLLPDTDSPSTRILFDSIMVGNFATYVLPLRAGEFVRPWLLTRSTKYSFSSAFVSVVLERFFDLSAVLISFGALLFYLAGLPDWAHKGAGMLSGLAVFILIFILVGSFIPDTALGIARFFLRIVPQKPRAVLDKFLSDFLHGAEVIRSPKRLFLVCFFTALVWGSCFLIYFVTLWLFAIPGTFLMCVTLTVITALAVAAPSAPGFLGIYQTACVAGFALFGVSKEVAVAYSIVTHALQFLLFVLYGMYTLAAHNLRFSDLRKSS